MKEGLIDHGLLALEGTPTEMKKKDVCKTNLDERWSISVKQDISREKLTDFHYENQLVMVSRVSH